MTEKTNQEKNIMKRIVCTLSIVLFLAGCTAAAPKTESAVFEKNDYASISYTDGSGHASDNSEIISVITENLSAGKSSEHDPAKDELVLSFVLTKKDKTDTELSLYKSGKQTYFLYDGKTFDLTDTAYEAIVAEIEKVSAGK